MTKRALVILAVVAVTLAGAAAVIASSVGGSSNDEPVHTLPSGQIHTGEMPEGQEMENGEGMNMGE